MKDRILDTSKIEKLVIDKGWTNLQWCSGDNQLNPFMTEVNGKIIVEKARFRLYGCPPNYKGECEGYKIPILIEIFDKWKTRGYKWAFNKFAKRRKYVREED